MANIRSRLAGLLGRAKKAPELSSSVVKHDKLDDGVLQDMVDRALLFRRTMFNQPEIDLDTMTDADGNPVELTDDQREQAEGYVAWEDLFGDVFRSLHTYHEPELLPEKEVKPSRELNRRIIQQIQANDNFQKLRPDTRHSPIEAAFTSISMADKLSELLNTELREFVERANQMDEIEDQIEQNGQPDPNGTPGDADSSGNGSGGGQPDPNGQATPDGDLPDDLANQLADLDQQQQEQGLGTSVMDAIEEAMDEGKEAADAISNLPGVGSGPGTRVSPDKMIELAQEWRDSPILRKVSLMTGRLQRDMRQQRARRVVGGTEEIVDVKLGNELALLLPHETVKLRHPLLKKDFQRRYHEQDLLQYETEGTDSAGRGPVVICLDGSGSMSGMRNEWARALSLSLITIAKREKRDAAAVEFSSGVTPRRWEFLKREPLDPEQVLDFVTHFFGGGTQIQDGMNSAVDFIENRPEFRKADIVLVTDGGDYFDDERDGKMREKLTEMGVRVHGISIGYDAEQNDYLQKMGDSSVTAYDMAGSNEATKHLAEVVT